MSLRWRKNGELICAANSRAESGDTYINDRLHYELSVIQKSVVPDIHEKTNGIWHWLHGECDVAEHEDEGVRQSPFIRVTKP